MVGKAFSLNVALDEDLAFEAILADIPLFCVGLMAMGFITFIFTMKRANSTALYLCTASLLLFIAAILDLGRLLILGPTQIALNVDPGVVSAFVVAREVGLGLSYGFLFLFIWMAVAQRPKSEPRMCIREPARNRIQSQPHSASWKRWGLVGLVLKWFTLLLAVVISLLQILWRIVSAQRRYGSLYVAESTLEIIASTVFFLKIVLNVLLASVTWWTSFRPYTPLALALVITAAMGAGNLATFAFSETILGRFLRAISIYILLLYSLIRTFDKRSVARSTADDHEAGSAIKHTKPRDPIIKTTDFKPAPTAVADTTRPSLLVSTSSRFSVLVSRTEKKEALVELTRISPKSVRRPPNTPITSPKRPRRQDLHFDIITPATEAPDSTRESTGISLTYYTMNFGLPETPNVPIIPEPSLRQIAPPPASTDGRSSIEIVRQAPLVAQTPPVHPNPSITSFDELMRQQNELDKSITNLRLLSVDTGSVQPLEAAPALEISPLGGDMIASAKSRPQSTLRTDSLSQHSEFSLSVFPLPPPRPESGVGDKPPSIPRVPFRKLPQLPPHPPSQDLPSPSILESPLQNSVPMRLTSAGTQYDVTSFIDSLAEPAGTETTGTLQLGDLPTEAEGVLHISERNGELGSVLGNPASNLKPMLLPSVAGERRDLPSPHIRPMLNETRSPSQPAPRDSSAALKPFLLGTAVSSIPVSLPSSTMVALGPRRGGRTVRVAAQKSQISGPKFSASDSLTEGISEAYERPRPPPPLGPSDSPQT